MTHTLSLERMAALYAVAQRHNLAIIEDDAYYWIQLAPVDAPSKALPRTQAQAQAQPRPHTHAQT
jgi:DNA-binding transcriptional MocR family regulator